MQTQKKSASRTTAAQTAASSGARKLHSIHALPDGKNFTGKIEVGKASYELTFAPQVAELQNGDLRLRGAVTVKSPAGQMRTASNVEAVLLATQGNIHPAPAIPTKLPDGLLTAQSDPEGAPITEATYALSSVGVIYWKLSALDGRALGVPMDLSAVQLNARLFPESELEADLQWYYSGLVLARAEKGSEKKMAGYLAEINRLFKA